MAVHEQRRLAPARYFADLADSFRTAARARGCVERDLELGGRAIRLRFAGEGLVPVLLPALRHLVTSSGRADASVCVWDSATTGVPLPPYPWRTEAWGPRGTIRGFDDDRILLHFDPGGGGLSMYDPDAAAEALFVVADARAVPWYERAAPLRTTLHWLLSGPGRHLVHGGVVGKGGRAVLIGGASGAGKSTTAVACLESGFDYLGDDYVLVALEDDPVAYSLYATAKLDARSLDLMPWLKGTAVAYEGLNDGKAKMVLPVYDIRPERLPARAELVAVVLPRVVGGPDSRLRATTASESLRALAPSTIIQMPHEARSALDLLTELVSRVPSYRLEVGSDVASVPAALDDLLGRV